LRLIAHLPLTSSTWAVTLWLVARVMLETRVEQAATMPRVVCVPISETALRVDQSGNIVPPSKVIFNDAL